VHMHAYACIACLCMHMHGYAFICMHMHAYPCMGMPMHAYACICMHMHAYAYICIDIHAYPYMCMHRHAYAGICMHMHAYACRGMNMHIHEYACLWVLHFHQPRLGYMGLSFLSVDVKCRPAIVHSMTIYACGVALPMHVVIKLAIAIPPGRWNVSCSYCSEIPGYHVQPICRLVGCVRTGGHRHRRLRQSMAA